MRLKSYAVFLVVSLFATSTFACSCVSQSLSQQFSNANNIFIGRIVATHEIKSRSDMPDWGGVQGQFELIETLKGNQKLVKYVETGYGAGDCGVPLLTGQTYIFFTGSKGEISICSGTVSYVAGYEKHEAFLKKLKKLNTNATKP